MIEFISCPITGQIFKDPVKASDGHTYERKAIKKWFSKNSTSPMTSSYIHNKELISDHSMKSLVQKFRDSNPEYKLKSYNKFDANKILDIFVTKKYDDLLNYKNFKLTTIGPDNQSLMFLISKIPNLEVFKHVYKNSIDKKERDHQYKYLIHYIAKNSPLSFIKYLYEQNCDLTAKTMKDKTVLHIVAKRNDPYNEIFEYICDNVKIDHKAKTNCYGEHGYSVLYYLIKGKKLDLVKIFWNATTVLEEYDYYLAKPIHILAKYMPFEILNNLDYYSEYLNLKDCKGCNILHYMFNKENTDQILYMLKIILLNKNLKELLDQKSGSQGTPITFIIKVLPNDLEIWKLIFLHNINLQNGGDEKDLLLLVRSTNQDKILEYILAYMEINNPGFKNEQGVIDYCIIYKKPDSFIFKYCELLLNKKVDDLTYNGETILHLVIRSRPDLLSYIIKYLNKDQINMNNKQGITSIHEAARYVGLSAISFLEQKGANINVKTKEGKDILYYLMNYHINDVIPFLKKYPVELNNVYSNGTMLLHYVLNEHTYWIFNNTVLFDTIYYMVSHGLKTEYYGKMNLVYILLNHFVAYSYKENKNAIETFKKYYKLFGSNGLDRDLKIKDLTVGEILKSIDL